MFSSFPPARPAGSRTYRKDASIGAGWIRSMSNMYWVSGITTKVNRGLSGSGLHVPRLPRPVFLPSSCAPEYASACASDAPEAKAGVAPSSPVAVAAAPAPRTPAPRRKVRRLPAAGPSPSRSAVRGQPQPAECAAASVSRFRSGASGLPSGVVCMRAPSEKKWMLAR